MPRFAEAVADAVAEIKAETDRLRKQNETLIRALAGMYAEVRRLERECSR